MHYVSRGDTGSLEEINLHIQSNYSQDILVNKTQFIIPNLTDETLNMVHNILLEISSGTFERNYENSSLNWKTTHTHIGCQLLKLLPNSVCK